MNAKYIRWRCERVDQLLATETPRLELLVVIRQEELARPWEQDPRPNPRPLPMGDAHYGLNPKHLQPTTTAGFVFGAPTPWHAKPGSPQTSRY